ncbi:hypothetical protein PIB30_035734 [Stylosanthes scabra]|uniref:Uncharacterized protein n=1 Tax=Stylosanthes scabra TaxID=79078 RepID=A0ABU6ZA25_9FABA|nr:hypothetical protein [Stylosanthes scabra]
MVTSLIKCGNRFGRKLLESVIKALKKRGGETEEQYSWCEFWILRGKHYFSGFGLNQSSTIEKRERAERERRPDRHRRSLSELRHRRSAPSTPRPSLPKDLPSSPASRSSESEKEREERKREERERRPDRHRRSRSCAVEAPCLSHLARPPQRSAIVTSRRSFRSTPRRPTPPSLRSLRPSSDQPPSSPSTATVASSSSKTATAPPDQPPSSTFTLTCVLRRLPKSLKTSSAIASCPAHGHLPICKEPFSAVTGLCPAVLG